MEKLAVFKVVNDVMELCGFFDSKEDAIAYLTEVKKIINTEMKNSYAGEYLLVPTIYFHLKEAGQ
jgi:hypothetical protein